MTNTEKLTSKVAMVTGGASGIGKAIAQRLAAEGATVIITDVQSDLGNETASQGGFIFLEQDVCNESLWNDAVREVEARCGGLDILVNNAGIAGPMDAGTPESTRLTDWRRIFAVNVEGVFLGCRAAIAAMRRGRGGSIVNISSVAGLLATPAGIAYGASKAAVRQLTKSLAQYCAQEKLNIRCNSVHPGIVMTQLMEKVYQDLARQRAVPIEKVIAQGIARIPLGDFTRPEDIANLVAFLVSDQARHITGAKFSVDGGIVDCDTYLASIASKSSLSLQGQS